MIAFEQRASTVLFNLVRSHEVPGPILLPANVCPIVPLVLCKARRDFEFVDIDAGSLCMSHSAAIDRYASTQIPPAGVLYVRTYGALDPAETFFAAIKSMSPDALVIDDRCLCEPSFPATPAPHVDAVVYSTGHAKQVDLGFGGFAVLRDTVPYRRSHAEFSPRDLKSITEDYREALRTGRRFDYTDSAWLITTPPTLTWNAYRQQIEQEIAGVTQLKANINAIYEARLPRSIQFSPQRQTWRFNLQVSNKSAVLSTIRRGGLFASGHYQSVAHVFGSGAAPLAERLHHHVVNLFNDRNFSVHQANLLANLLEGMNLSPPEPRWT